MCLTFGKAAKPTHVRTAYLCFSCVCMFEGINKKLIKFMNKILSLVTSKICRDLRLQHWRFKDTKFLSMHAE